MPSSLWSAPSLKPYPNKLRGERVINPDKITDYLLDVRHPEGGGKARFFIGHGFAPEEPEALISAIHAHAETHEIAETQPGVYGTKTVVRCSIRTPDGRNPCILAIWIRENGCSGQRLVTAYPFDV
jgi:hypothetical protein